jgi:hypothetical protein
MYREHAHLSEDNGFCNHNKHTQLIKFSDKILSRIEIWIMTTRSHTPLPWTKIECHCVLAILFSSDFHLGCLWLEVGCTYDFSSNSR